MSALHVAFLVSWCFCMAVALFFLFGARTNFLECLGAAAALEWLLIKAIDKSLTP